MKNSLLTVVEAAAVKGVSSAAIYAAISRQKLPRRYKDGNLAVLESDLAAWQENPDKGGRPKGRPFTNEHKAKLRAARKRRESGS